MFFVSLPLHPFPSSQLYVNVCVPNPADEGVNLPLLLMPGPDQVPPVGENPPTKKLAVDIQTVWLLPALTVGEATTLNLFVSVLVHPLPLV